MAVKSKPKKATRQGVRRPPGSSSLAAAFREATASKRATRLRPGSAAARAVEEARDAGLLKGDSSEHLSFRVPKALFEAAKREAGANSPTDVGVAALAIMAQPDPVAAYFKETFGRLGANFDLEY